MAIGTFDKLECARSGECATHENGKCDACHRAIADEDSPSTYEGDWKDFHKYRNMKGSGFQSISVWHYHFKAVEDVRGRQVVMRELCIECYREDFRKTYPTAELPL